ncbi:monocarboxylate transporter 5-like [Lytechinus variegatus]|uniref:monocarboxylate transporter 5-like n=1 Tax=Lytechinus variegatus TaxID=7654 RepID=UPI001BB2161C|nr:monocarboxylate transporter 5-like [Lytechinus variegatus]
MYIGMDSSKGQDYHISNRKWGYVILLSKFVINMWSGIAKSFGVLLPLMVERFHGNYASLAFICSIPMTVSFFSGPFVALILKKVNHRAAAMSGGIICAVSLIACGFISNITVFGILLTLTGMVRMVFLAPVYIDKSFFQYNSITGFRGFVYIPLTILLNEYFKDNFALINTVASFGATIGITFLPVVAERSLEAYGYHAVFMMLGGIMLHLVAAAATIRKPIIKVKDHTTGQSGHHLDIPEADHLHQIGRVLSTRDGHEARSKTKTMVKKTGAVDGSSKGTAKTTTGQLRSDQKRTSSIIKNNGKIQNDLNKHDKGERRGEDVSAYSVYSDEDMEQNVPLINRRIDSDDQNPSKPDEDNDVKKSLWSGCKHFITQETLFLGCLPVIYFHDYSMQVWVLFLVPHAEYLGIDQSTAVFLSSFGGLGGIIGRIIAVILLAKKVHMFKIYIVVGFVNSLTFFLDFVGWSFLVRSVLAFIQGFCFFLLDTAGSTFLQELVEDDRNFSFALGLIMFMRGCSSISAGFLTGTLIDTLQSFTKVFMITGIWMAISTINIAVLLLILIKREKSKSQCTVKRDT